MGRPSPPHCEPPLVGSAADLPSGEPRRLTPGNEADPYASQPAASNPLRDRFADDAPAAAPATTPAEPYGDPNANPYAATSDPVAEPQAFPQQQYPAADPLGAATIAEAEPMSEGTGVPGDPQLAGVQAPALTIEKVAPPEVQIGKPATFAIQVRNTGTATAHGVEVHDQIPQGTQLIDTSPPANRGPEGQLVWDVGTLKPGDEKTIEVQLMPIDEGEIGSVATVHMQAHASVRTVSTKPMLNIEVLGPSKVHKGEQLTLRVKLSNPGSGTAQGFIAWT